MIKRAGVIMISLVKATGHVRWGNLYVSDVGKRDGGEWITPEVRGFNTKAGTLCIFDLLRKDQVVQKKPNENIQKEDIQCVSFDTRPPMLDRTEFVSWQQRIRLYCQGKENEVNIPKLIDEVPFKMGTLRETLTEGTKGALHLWPERPRVYSELTSKETDRNQATIQDEKVVIQNVQGRHNRGQGNNAYGAGAAGYGGAQNRVGRMGVTLDEEQLLFIVGGQDDVVDDDILVMKKPVCLMIQTFNLRTLDFQITQLTENFSALQEQNELFKVDNAKVRQHYKELYDSIKITRAKHIDQTTALLIENENLNVQINAKLKCVTIDYVTPKVLAHVYMASLADKAILSGAENRPPTLEKDMYDSWRSRMELYMLNRQHGRMILESVEHGPLLWPSVTKDGVTRLKNILNCHKLKLFKPIMMLKQQISFFKHFLQRFMHWSVRTRCQGFVGTDSDANARHIFQVNTKFLNTLPSEWSKFVTDVKLKRRNDVKARTTLLMALPDEHQLRFSKYKTAQELWAAILKIFGGNEATKMTKKNKLKQQYGNFKAEEWLMYMIVWRNRSDLDTLSLDDLYNHLKVYELEVQKKSESNSHNMAFISSAKNSSEKEEVNTTSIPTASTQVSPTSANVAAANISHDTACTNVVGFDKSKVEYFNYHKMGHFARECRAPKSQERRRREVYRQGLKEEESAPKALMVIDRVGWDWSYMANEEENHALVADEEAPTEFTLMAKSSSDNENEESSKSIMSKPMIKFVKAADSPKVIKTNKVETVRKPFVKYVEMYRDTHKIPKEAGHLNFKTMNKLVRHNLVRGLPSKCFKNDHTCVACLKGKQHKASCKTKLVHSMTKPLRTSHMDLFGPTSDETSDIVRNFITVIENLKDLKVKIIRCDNRGEFRNKEMNDFCSRKEIKREFSNARTLQQNGVAKRRNKTLIEAARTMLADAKLPVTFWAETVNTACYVQNKVLVNKSQNKTPYELFNGTKDAASQDVKKDVSFLRYIALPNWFHEAHLEIYTSNTQDACNANAPESSGNSNPTATSKHLLTDQIETLTVETPILTVSSPVPTACLNDSPEPSSNTRLISKRVTSQDDTPSLDNILTFLNRFEDTLGVTTNTGDTNGVEADLGNMEHNILASSTPTFRIYKDHPKSQIISPVDTSEEPKKISDALKDPSWVEAMQEELLQFKIQNVWTLVDCLEGVFAPVARIEAIRLFLAYASFMGFTVYQMDVKSAFLYDTIDEEVYVMHPPGFQDLEFPARVYKMEKAMYGLHQAHRAWYGTLSKYLLTNGFQRGTIDQTLFIRKHRGDFLLVQVYVDDIIFGSSNLQLCREFEALMHEKLQMSAIGELNFCLGLQVLQKKDGIFLSQDKYVGDFLKKFRYSDVRHQVTTKECHLHVVKRIFRYLKGHPKLGIWYPKDFPFDLVAYSDSDYSGATQDRKSTTRGCQFLGRRLISWQCKKQTIMATLTTEAEYAAAASGCGQVRWIQNQLVDYGLAFCDYHNMIAILEKYEHNVDFHQIVDFVEASYIRHALTINPTVYVSHIRQFWSTAMIKTMDEGTKILATMDGKFRTISESSIRRNLKLNDEAGISSLPDAELFENLALMGYTILPNQKFTFQKVAILPLLWVNSPSFLGRTVPLFDSMPVNQGEGSGTPAEPHHIPTPEAQQSPQHDLSSSIYPPVTTETIPTLIPTKIPTVKQYSKRARITQSSALPTAVDESASPLGDDNQGDSFPTVSGLEVKQDRENIIKTFALPYDSPLRQTEMASKIAAQDLEITSLKARIKLLEDKDGGGAEPSGKDATIKGRSLETGEEAGVEKNTERGSNDTEELVNILTSLDTASILTSRVQVVSIPPAAKVFIVGKEKMVESDTSKKKKLQEQMDVQMAREIEEQLARKDQRMNEQIAKDAEIARIHAEEELQILIDGLDRNNETIAKYL
nr:hypothetical protein [Tanacetum cinerariifolium]